VQSIVISFSFDFEAVDTHSGWRALLASVHGCKQECEFSRSLEMREGKAYHNN
jgi:hypothetical protein